MVHYKVLINRAISIAYRCKGVIGRTLKKISCFTSQQPNRVIIEPVEVIWNSNDILNYDDWTDDDDDDDDDSTYDDWTDDEDDWTYGTYDEDDLTEDEDDDDNTEDDWIDDEDDWTDDEDDDNTDDIINKITNIYSSDQCVICQINIPEILMDQCGHKCLCEECNELYKNNRCPLCRTNSSVRIKIS